MISIFSLPFQRLFAAGERIKFETTRFRDTKTGIRWVLLETVSRVAAATTMAGGLFGDDGFVDNCLAK